MDIQNSSLDRRAFLAGALAASCGTCAFLNAACAETPETSATLSLALPGPAVEGPDAEARFVADARHWEAGEGGSITCRLCPRECKVPPEERGYCGVRENRGGKYKTLVFSRPCAVAIDPIEKKPLFHVLPARRAFSLSTAGCNIECKFCQNWQTSQSRPEQVDSIYAPPEQVVRAARQNDCAAIAFTYTEPVVFYEYMDAVAIEAQKQNVRPVMISNGYIQEKPLRELLPHLAAVKIDLKGFSEKFYKETCNAELKPVLETLTRVRAAGVWLEIVVLIVPTLNDGAEECQAMCAWIAKNLGGGVPVHFTRFHPMYKLTNLPPTPLETLDRNWEIAKAAGLKYAYVGNVPGHPGESTHCPKCAKVVIERYGMVARSLLKEGGVCPGCGEKIPGVWD